MDFTRSAKSHSQKDKKGIEQEIKEEVSHNFNSIWQQLIFFSSRVEENQKHCVYFLQSIVFKSWPGLLLGTRLKSRSSTHFGIDCCHHRYLQYQDGTHVTSFRPRGVTSESGASCCRRVLQIHQTPWGTDQVFYTRLNRHSTPHV